MPSDEKKEPIENVKDKFRSLFGFKDPQKKKGALPPKAHFSIWYFLMAFFLFSSIIAERKTPTLRTGIDDIIGFDGL